LYIFPDRQTYLFEGRVLSGRFRPEFPGCKGKWFCINKLLIDMTTRTKRIVNNVIVNQNDVIAKHVFPQGTKNNLHLLVRHPFSTIKFFKKIVF